MRYFPRAVPSLINNNSAQFERDCVALTRGSAILAGDENPPPKGQHSSARGVDLTNRTRGLAPLCTDQSRFATTCPLARSIRAYERALTSQPGRFCIRTLRCCNKYKRGIHRSMLGILFRRCSAICILYHRLQETMKGKPCNVLSRVTCKRECNTR